MSKKYSLFGYKAGHSPLHRLPAWIKLLTVPIVNTVFFVLPFYAAAVCIGIQSCIACVIGFSVKEQVRDIKPVLYYAVILYTTRFIGLSFSLGFITGLKETVYNGAVLMLLLKLFCIIQTASLMFKTSTSLEIREGIGTIEHAIRKWLPVSKKNTVTEITALFVCFIPMVHLIWEQSKRAWYVRHGTRSLTMYITLLPVLFSIGMKKAYNAAKAVTARSSVDLSLSHPVSP